MADSDMMAAPGRNSSRAGLALGFVAGLALVGMLLQLVAWVVTGEAPGFGGLVALLLLGYAGFNLRSLSSSSEAQGDEG